MCLSAHKTSSKIKIMKTPAIHIQKEEKVIVQLLGIRDTLGTSTDFIHKFPEPPYQYCQQWMKNCRLRITKSVMLTQLEQGRGTL